MSNNLIMSSSIQEQIFFKQQVEATKHIVQHYKQNNRYVILYADLQSGKSGTFHCVSICMLRSKLINKVIILCGMNDNELKQQAIDDYQKTYMKKYKTIMGNNYNEGSVNIIFQKDIEKLLNDKNDKNYFNNSLIIIDESDRTQDNNQQKNLLLNYCGLRLDGDPTVLKNNNIYILSVSATAFSEISALKHGLSYDKKIVKLNIDKSKYRGIEYFYKNNLIHSTFDIKNNKEQFINVVKSKGLSYNLIRIYESKTRKDYDIVKDICHTNNFDFIDYDMENTKNINEIITDEKPKKPTLIIIKGKLRAGKVINNKQNIGFVWENSLNPNTDVLLQGLPGRCCGYHNYNIDIYIPERILKIKLYNGIRINEIDRYIDSYKGTEINIIPNYANNIVPNKGTNDNDNDNDNENNREMKYSTNVLCVSNLFSEDDEKLPKSDFERKIKRSTINHIIENNSISNIHTEQQEEVKEIISNISNYTTTIRHYKLDQYSGNNNKGCLLDDFHKSSINNAPYQGSQGIIKKKDNTIVYYDIVFAPVYHNYKFKGTNNGGDVYVFFRTKKQPSDIEYLPLLVRIPITTGNELFRKLLLDGNPVGGIIFKIPIQNDPKSFELQLDKYIELWKFTVGLTISSVINCNNSELNKNKYFNSNKHFDKIIKNLSTKYRITITPKLNDNILETITLK
jgi:hypothetical protein